MPTPLPVGAWRDRTARCGLSGCRNIRTGVAYSIGSGLDSRLRSIRRRFARCLGPYSSTAPVVRLTFGDRPISPRQSPVRSIQSPTIGRVFDGKLEDIGILYVGSRSSERSSGTSLTDERPILPSVPVSAQRRIIASLRTTPARSACAVSRWCPHRSRRAWRRAEASPLDNR